MNRKAPSSLSWTIALSLVLGSLSPGFASEALNHKDPNYWNQLCVLLENSKPEEALVACGRALELLPKNAGLWARYGGLQLTLKQYSEAIASLEESLKRERKNSQALTDQCIAWLELGRKEQAAATCDKAIKINARWGTRSPLIARRYRSLSLDKPEAYQETIQFYDQTLEKTPTSSLALFYKAEALAKLEQYREAIATADQALNGDGNWSPEAPALAWLLKATAHRTLGELEQAVQAIDRALHLTPTHAPTWFEQGNILQALNRLTESLVAYNRAVELQPTASRMLLAQCIVLNRLQQAEPALAACQKAIQGDGNWGVADVAQAWNQQSRALTVLNKLEEALASANRAVGMRPDWGDAWNDRAVVLWYLTRYEEALGSVQQALDLNGDDARAWANQGRIWRSLEQPEKAFAAYTEALKRDPNNANIWANQSAVQWSLGDHPAALESANRAIALNPRLVQAWQNRAVAQIALKEYAEAQLSYQQAIDLDENNAEAWTGLGLLLAQQRQFPEAIEAFQKAVALNPNQTIAQRALQALTEMETPESGE